MGEKETRGRTIAKKTAAQQPVTRFVVRTLAEVGEFFGLPLSTVKNWSLDPAWPHKPGRGRSSGQYDLAAVAKWMLAKKNSDDDELAVERLRLTKAQADLKELELARKRGDVFAAEEVRTGLAELSGAVRAGVEAIQSQYGASSGDRILAAISVAQRRFDAMAKDGGGGADSDTSDVPVVDPGA